jgi:hypothetical protein
VSAWDRLDPDYRALCEKLAKERGPRTDVLGKVPHSPRNRRIRFGADMYLAKQKTFFNTETRQQRRAAAR